MFRTRAAQFLQAAVDAGRFGDAGSAECSFDDSVGQDQFASSVVFARVRGAAVVVKMQQDSAFVREAMNTDAQFYNEALMYEQVLPLLDAGDAVADIFPRLYYARATDGATPQDDVVVIEDLRARGYRLSEERLFLDYVHCEACLRQLGRFHALSYAAKQRDFQQFTQTVGRLKEVHYIREHRDDSNKYWTPFIERGMVPLFDRGGHRDVLESFAERMQDPFAFMKSLVAPEEPLSVLCHGDFCRNNVLFQYEAGRPAHVKLFDLATARYCSPAIDLSFFFFLNVPSALRRTRWDDLLAAYHEGLSSAVPGTRVPPLDVIRLEMRRKAAYAYVLCSFFIPTMMAPDRIEMEDFAMLGQDEMEEMARTMGGQEATDAIVDILQDLIANKCL